MSNPINQVTLDDFVLNCINHPKNKKLAKVFEDFLKNGDTTVFEIDSGTVDMEDLIKSLIYHLSLDPKKFRVFRNSKPKGLSELGMVLVNPGEVEFNKKTLEVLLIGIGAIKGVIETPWVEFKAAKELSAIDWTKIKGPISIPGNRKAKKSDKVVQGLEVLRILKAIGKKRTLAKVTFR